MYNFLKTVNNDTNEKIEGGIIFMRRENRRRPIEDGLDTKKMLYIVGSVLALAVIAFVITFLIYGNQLNNDEQLAQLNTNSIGTITATEEASNPYGRTVNEMQNETNTITDGVNSNEIAQNSQEDSSKIAVNTSKAEEKKDESKENTTTTKSSQTNKSQDNSQNTEKNKEEETQKQPDPEFKKPVEGDIMKEFANNKLVYSSTLDVWATHNGIDIAADKTTVVKAAADGTVSSIKNDPRYGLTVIIEHANGYKTVYSNLLSTEFVVEGEEVKQGQSIGTVGNTAAFEISDEPHLHFELLKDNEQQDPELYLK